MVTVKLQTSAGFRSIEKFMIILNSYYHLTTKTPSHVTISNWVKKAGYYQITMPKEKANDWILIIDESIQIGAEKLLLILGIRVSKIGFTRALNYKDITIISQVSKSGWNSELISEEIKKAEAQLGNIYYAVSDRGPSIRKALNLCNIPQIHDLTHRVGNILKKVYKNDNEFIDFTKQASALRLKIQQTKWAFLLPPNQRSQSRFLNLKPVIKWATNMLLYLKTDLPEDFPIEKFAWINKAKSIINELNTVMTNVEKIFTLLKNIGINKDTINELKEDISTLKTERSIQVKNELIIYFQECLELVPNEKNILCTSDIIESCFGKYKNNISKNSLCGITNLSLFIPASTCDTDIKEIKIMMESVTMKMIKQWTQKNIGQSLLKKRRDALNRNGTENKLKKVA